MQLYDCLNPFPASGYEKQLNQYKELALKRTKETKKSLKVQHPLILDEEEQAAWLARNKESPVGRKIINTLKDIGKFIRSASENIPCLYSLFQIGINQSPAGYLARDYILKTHNDIYPDSKWEGRTYTENDLSQRMLSVIDSQVRQRAKDLGINKDSFQQYNDTIKVPLDAKNFYPLHYDKFYGYVDDSPVYSQLNPLGQVERTLGDYTIYYTPDGYIVKDVYDFNKGQGLYIGHDGWYAKLRRKAGEVNSSNKRPNKYKNKFEIHGNVNSW